MICVFALLGSSEIHSRQGKDVMKLLKALGLTQKMDELTHMAVLRKLKKNELAEHVHYFPNSKSFKY